MQVELVADGHRREQQERRDGDERDERPEKADEGEEQVPATRVERKEIGNVQPAAGRRGFYLTRSGDAPRRPHPLPAAGRGEREGGAGGPWRGWMRRAPGCPRRRAAPAGAPLRPPAAPTGADA